MDFINLIIENKISMSAAILIVAFWFLKVIFSSPKETLNLIEHLTKKKIKDLDELLKLPSLHDDDIKKIEQEQRKLALQKLTGIRNINKVIPLFDIIKKQDLPVTFFEKSSQYINNKNGNLTLDTGWTFWLFDWVFTRIISIMVISQSNFIIIYSIFDNKIKPHTFLLLLIIFLPCVLFGVYIWKTSLTISKIKSIELILEESQRDNE
ncbi:hypothetical protein [Edaphovirga cremea]|uniref:hypothetical protein n=1 Tax=Edaphovirga cremea TaxID=2267246 RepID=UPI000DEF592A|nr:hypothetical protein [Edaphovirga cremea]